MLYHTVADRGIRSFTQFTASAGGGVVASHHCGSIRQWLKHVHSDQHHLETKRLAFGNSVSASGVCLIITQRLSDSLFFGI